MEKRNLTPDYFPVYKDLSSGHFSIVQERLEPSMFSATEVIEESSTNGFTLFQTVVLLVKNAFEGHVFMNTQLRPQELMESGTILFHGEQGSLVYRFYQKLDQYMVGLNQAWEQLKVKHPGLGDVSFEAVVYALLINQLLRISVVFCDSSDIMRFKGLTTREVDSLRQLFCLMLLGERFAGDLLVMENIDNLYREKFNDSLKKLQMKGGILSHYERKRVMSYNPNIKTEEDLDVCMYDSLVESRVKSSVNRSLIQQGNEETAVHGSKRLGTWLNNRIKFLYRAVSKNCAEVHNSLLQDSSLPELNRVFMSANTLYNDLDYTIHDPLIKYMRMMILFSEVTAFREEQGLDKVKGNVPDLDAEACVGLFPKEFLIDYEKILEEKVATLRASNFTDFKVKNIFAEDMAEIHRICLDKELEFIDEQIKKVQLEIEEVMKTKSQSGNSTS